MLLDGQPYYDDGYRQITVTIEFLGRYLKASTRGTIAWQIEQANFSFHLFNSATSPYAVNERVEGDLC